MTRPRPALRLFVLAALALPAAAQDGEPARTEPRIRVVEEALDTDGKSSYGFHAAAENPYAVGLAFPGVVIGVEKADADVIKAPDDDEWQLESIAEAWLPEDARDEVEDRVDDENQLFVSHIVAFDHGETRGPKGPFRFLRGRRLYSVYETAAKAAYNEGRDALGSLRDGRPSALTRALEKRAEGATHIILAVMGWNTSQVKAARQFNSLIGFTAQAWAEDAAEKPFAPLFIGVTWPSYTPYARGIDFQVQRDDADELGMIWLNRLIHEVLGPLKSRRGIPLVALGHSFGARALLRASVSRPLIDARYRDAAFAGEASPIDLTLALQPALPIKGFIDEEAGFYWPRWRGGAGAVVMTASEHDSAAKIPRLWTRIYAGSGRAVRAVREEKEYREAFVLGRVGGDGRGPLPELAPRSAANRVLLVDAGALICRENPEHGGGAHSDIYRIETGRFIASVLRRYAPGRTRPQ